ncbi:hypothetical protein IWZ00DRAFT_541423 [Phyllosticta capitalensis]
MTVLEPLLINSVHSEKNTVESTAAQNRRPSSALRSWNQASNKTAATQTEAEQRCDIVSAATALPELHSQTAVANSCSVAPETSDEPNGDSGEGESDEELDEESEEELDEEPDEDPDGEPDEDPDEEPDEDLGSDIFDDNFDEDLKGEKMEKVEEELYELYYTVNEFKEDAHWLIARHLFLAADDPKLDDLAHSLRSRISDRTGMEIVALFQDAEWIFECELKALHKLATAYKKRQNEGRIKKSADKKRKASPATDGPPVQRPRNA